MKVRRVTVEAPTRSRMAPKLGTDSAIKRRHATERERNTHLFQLKSLNENIQIFMKMSLYPPEGIFSICSKN